MACRGVVRGCFFVLRLVGGGSGSLRGKIVVAGIFVLWLVGGGSGSLRGKMVVAGIFVLRLVGRGSCSLWGMVVDCFWGAVVCRVCFSQSRWGTKNPASIVRTLAGLLML